MDNTWVSHGMTTHPISESWKCENCKETQKEMDDAIVAAGGMEQFLKNLEEM